MSPQVRWLEFRAGVEGPIETIVEDIVKLNTKLRDFWSEGARGWAPPVASDLLERSRLDRQVHLSTCLREWVTRRADQRNDGHLILAWANLGALVEGSMMLLLAVYYKDYLKHGGVQTKNGQIRDPDTLDLDPMRAFFRDKVWLESDKWDQWIGEVQRRRNAIHAFRDRDLGTFADFEGGVRKYLAFADTIDSRLPYP